MQKTEALSVRSAEQASESDAQRRRTVPFTELHCTIDGDIDHNPGGNSYGSFEFRGLVHRRHFGGGHGHTNNTAEVQTAAECLEWLAENVQFPHMYHVVLHTDSQLACGWLNEDRNPKTGQVHRLVELLERFRRQRKAFRSVKLVWHPRAQSVAVLGH